ncbi:MAG: hypothetical protein P1U32_00120 [Legionellaceae bacterium]|nr:hypothetical protein [Legionellaceae bacterium]
MKGWFFLGVLVATTTWASNDATTVLENILPDEMPLALCANAITQPYTVPVSRTVEELVLQGYSDDACTVVSASPTLTISTGTRVLPSSGSWSWCLDTTAGNWRQNLCSLAGIGAGAGTGSVRLEIVRTAEGPDSAVTGNCMTVVCSGGATGWTLQSEGTAAIL